MADTRDRELVLTEKKPKHLEFIQQGIDRMENNAILLKGWTIILAATLLGLFATDNAGVALILAICLPVIGFWFLDAYFLSQERMLRTLHNRVRFKEEDEIDFSMDLGEFKSEGRNNLIQSMFFSSLFLFYLPMVVIVIAVALIR